MASGMQFVAAMRIHELLSKSGVLAIGALALSGCVTPDADDPSSDDLAITTADADEVPTVDPAAPWKSYKSEFCRKLKAPNSETKATDKHVMAAALAAVVYGDETPGGAIHPPGPLVKGGLVRIPFQYTNAFGLKRFYGELYADVNNRYVGSCIVVAVQGTQVQDGANNAVSDVLSDLGAGEIRRLGVSGGMTLPGSGPPAPLYVAQGFDDVSQNARAMLEDTLRLYPEILPTSGPIEVEFFTGQSMGGAIAGVLTNVVEHFNISIYLPGRPTADAPNGSCPVAGTSPIARVVNKTGGVLFQAPRAIAVIPGNPNNPAAIAQAPITSYYAPEDLVPKLPSKDLRSVFAVKPFTLLNPAAAPNEPLSMYTDWSDPHLVTWPTAAGVTTTTWTWPFPGIASPSFTVPAAALSVTFATGWRKWKPCDGNVQKRALEMAATPPAPCDGNNGAVIKAAGPPADLDQRSGFLKYVFAYAAGRLWDQVGILGFPAGVRGDDLMNNRYPALASTGGPLHLAPGKPLAPDAPVAFNASCPYGAYCNNPVGLLGLLGTLLNPGAFLGVVSIGGAGSLPLALAALFTKPVYMWNPNGTAMFLGELLAGAKGTFKFHNPLIVTTAVGASLNRPLMIDTLDQIPNLAELYPNPADLSIANPASATTRWFPRLSCPTAPGLVGLPVPLMAIAVAL